MSRTSRTLTNTDLAFLLCTLAAASQSPKASLSFETDYGLVLSLEPDGSITISLREPVPQKQHEYKDPFDSTTPIKSQQLFAFPSATPAPVSHGSIDGVLFSPLAFVTGTGGASITPARSTPSRSMSGVSTPTLTRTSSQPQAQSQNQSQRNIANKSTSNSPNMKIKYYIRPGLDANSCSHMYYTASTSASASSSTPPHHQPQPRPTGNTKPTSKLRLHRVKLSHLQSLYHSPSSTSSRSNSWFDSYLDWIDRLEDALTQQRQQRQHEPQTPQTPRTAIPPSPISRAMPENRGDQGKKMGGNQGGPFTDEGEKSLWLVEGLLLASWLSLQEGVEGVEYLPLPDGGMEVYRLEQHIQGKGDGNTAGVMMGRLLEVIRAGE